MSSTAMCSWTMLKELSDRCAYRRAAKATECSSKRLNRNINVRFVINTRVSGVQNAGAQFCIRNKCQKFVDLILKT